MLLALSGLSGQGTCIPRISGSFLSHPYRGRVVLNRLNICLIAYKWYAAVRYYPTWLEVVVSLTVVFTELWVYRWIVNRMPVVSDSPEWAQEAP